MLESLKKIVHQVLIVITDLLLRLIPAPMPIVFAGPGSSAQLVDAIAQTGVKRVLVVTDAMLVKIGLLEPITAALQAAGVEVAVYDGVEPNPTKEQVEAGLAEYDRNGCEAALAVGGGSPMDAAKIILARAATRRSTEKLVGQLKVRGNLAPLFAIPTTAGTGSEVTIAAVVSDTVERKKLVVADPKLVPRMAALDAELMLGLPAPVTAATGMDALTHAVEAYVSQIANERTDSYARAAVRLIFAKLVEAYDDGSNREARQAMAMASFYAAVAFTRALVGYVHAIAHNFGGMYHTPHGLANAIVMPHVLDFYGESAASRLAELAVAAGIGERSEGDTELATRFIARIREMNQHMGIPNGLDTLREQDIPLIAERALEEAFGTYAVPRLMNQSECETVLRRMLV